MPTTIEVLSSEILSLIFAESLPLHTEVHNGNLNARARGPSDAAPLIVSWVCKQWRNAALATSVLWASIPLCVLDHSPLASNKHKVQRAVVAAAKLNAFAERAIGRSLSVAIGCPRVLGLHSAEQLEPIVEALDRLPNRTHIRWLSVHLPGNAIEAFAACAHDRLDFTGVTSLSLGFPRLSEGWPITMFAHFPNIRSLTLHSVSLSRLPGLPWSSLTDLFGDGYGIGDAVHIMRQAPNLRRAYINVLARHLEVHPDEGWNDEDREFGHPPDDTQRVSLDLMESFARHAPRVVTLDVHLYSWTLEDLESQIAKLDTVIEFSSLTSVSLDLGWSVMHSDWSPRENNRGSKMFQRIPALRSLATQSIRVAAFLPELSWASLTHFTGKAYSIVPFLRVMNQASNLTHACFELLPRVEELPYHQYDVHEEYLREPPKERVVLEQMKEFVIYEGCKDFAHALDYWALPSLRTLAVGRSGYWNEDIEYPEPCNLTYWRLELLDAWRLVEWPSWEDDPFRGLRIREAVFGGVVEAFARPFFLLLEREPEFLACLQQLEIWCHEHHEDDDIKSDDFYFQDVDESESQSSDSQSSESQSSESQYSKSQFPEAEPSTLETVLSFAGHAVLRRNSQSRSEADTAPSKISTLKFTSDSRNPEVFKLKAPQLELYRPGGVLHESGVVITLGSENPRFRVGWSQRAWEMAK
ncbi:hypothetical protein HMN09_01158300 [Mycena chlorophos]|uniref:F-box domain-containing protein n=1 Tax=Mycena chlorophos TaxID=658473 RepID=A0A8H6VZW7_MYCCL|nr:hypothetical protein HMN09_01158300 [Mycena chlorophos]